MIRQFCLVTYGKPSHWEGVKGLKSQKLLFEGVT